MTTARHRGSATVAERPEGSALVGKAPGGMWWVAWRQHRLQIAVLVALMAAFAAILVIFRVKVVHAWTSAGCDLAATGCDGPRGAIWYNDGYSMWSPALHLCMLLGPIVLGAFMGVPLFTREFAHGTHVLALTQSVGRLRWWTAKVVVTLVPLTAGLLALGFLLGWVDNSVGMTAHHSLGGVNLATRAVIPAAHGLATFAIAVGAGIVLRSTVSALVTALIVGSLAVTGLMIARPHMLPPTRSVTSYEARVLSGAGPAIYDTDPDVYLFGSGYLDAKRHVLNTRLHSCFPKADQSGQRAAAEASGSEDQAGSGAGGDGSGGTVSAGAGSGDAVVAAPADPYDSPAYEAAFNHSLIDCAHTKGVAYAYTDYLPGSMLWPMRWIMTGLSAILAALFLLLGAARLRPAVAKR